MTIGTRVSLIKKGRGICLSQLERGTSKYFVEAIKTGGQRQVPGCGAYRHLCCEIGRVGDGPGGMKQQDVYIGKRLPCRMVEIHHCEVLTPQSCEYWTNQVFLAQEHWTRRHPHTPFFTFGMAAYLDDKEANHQAASTSLYRQRILRDHSNSLLQSKFAPLYKELCLRMSETFGMAAHLIPSQAALPGFHIHLPHPAFAEDVASIHRDLQFHRVFPDTSFTPDQVITFTLPISLPPDSGLNLWQDDHKYFYPYKPGQMVIHSGLQTHQAVLRCAGTVPPRIALQGHGVLRDQELALYW
jgi:hypothetical protein